MAALLIAASAGTVDGVARAVSIVAVAIALASLAWQVISWRRSGARVQVTARWSGVFDDHDIGDTLIVTAHNEGRLDAEIVDVAYELHVASQQEPIRCNYRPRDGDSPIPLTLKGGHRGRWTISRDEIRSAVDDHSIFVKVWASDGERLDPALAARFDSVLETFFIAGRVELGTGQPRTSTMLMSSKKALGPDDEALDFDDDDSV